MKRIFYILGIGIFSIGIGIFIGMTTVKIEKTSINNKKVLFLGDSITEFSYMWRDEFIKVTGLKNIGCYAKGGATWREEISQNKDIKVANNNIPNQVRQILKDQVEDPDIIIISAGGNDWAMDSELTEVLESQFENSIGQVDVNQIQKNTFPGAIRWSVEKLKKRYPDAMIFLATNIQSAYEYKTYSSTKLKADITKKTAERMSVFVIDAFSLSGIYGNEEKPGKNGKYLQDGVHPNKKGGIRLGRCYANEVLKYYSIMEE